MIKTMYRKNILQRENLLDIVSFYNRNLKLFISKTAFLIICNFTIFLSCSDLPFSTSGKSKNFSPTAKILHPQDGELFAYGDTVLFLGISNDVDNNREKLLVQWNSDKDGLLYEGNGNIYGQSAFFGYDLTKQVHQISLVVKDSYGNVSKDYIELNYNLPDRVKILELRKENNFLKIVWSRSKIPNEEFDHYKIFRSSNIINDNKAELLATIISQNDTSFYCPINIGLNHYSVFVYDNFGNYTNSANKKYGSFSKISTEGYDEIRNFIFDYKRDLIYALTDSYQLLFINPKSLLVVSSLQLNTAWDFDIDTTGDTLYVGGQNKFIKIDLDNKQIFSSIDITDSAKQLVCGSQGILFITPGAGDVIMLDSYTGTEVFRTSSSYQIYHGILTISKDKQYLYAADQGISTNELYKYRINSRNLILVDYRAIGGYPHGPIIVSNDNSFVCFGHYKLNNNNFNDIIGRFKHDNYNYTMQLISNSDVLGFSATKVFNTKNMEYIGRLPNLSYLMEISENDEYLYTYIPDSSSIFVYQL